MIYLVITIVAMSLLYFFISYKYKSIINTFLPIYYVNFFAIIPAIFFIALNPNGFDMYVLNSKSYLLPSIYYLLSFISIVLGYMIFNNKYTVEEYIVVNSPKKNRLNEIKILLTGTIFILVGFLIIVYLYKALNMRIFIDSSRTFYDRTRVGMGTYYFLSNFFMEIGFLVILVFSKNKRIKLILTIIVMILSIVFGSKGIVLKYFLIYILYQQLTKKLNFVKNVIILVVSIFSLVFLFIYLSVGTTINNVFISIVNYSDYVKNFSVLIQYFNSYVSGGHTWGQLLYEGIVYPIVPRAIFHNKPIYFAALRIPLNFPIYKEATLLNQGAPSFGPFGELYYDFGLLSLPLVAIFGLVKGMLISIFEKRMIATNSLTDFSLYLLFIGLPILSVGIGNIFIPNILFILLIGFILKFFIGKGFYIFPKVKIKKRTGD